MSGHNRWTKIKHKKAAAGAAKGKLFSKLIAEITVAARTGGGDPAGNARLRAAMEAARDANMPQENVTRAVKKGTGEIAGVAYEEATYEGYGPGGVALIVECLTDNRNRTAGDVRSTFEKHGGHLAAQGAVSWGFDRRGIVEVKPGPTEDQVTEAAIDAGAEDVIPLGADGFEIRTHPNDLHAVTDALRRRVAVGGARLAHVPRDPVRLSDPERARAVLKLVDALDDLEDVQQVHGSFDLDEAILKELSP